MTVSPDQEDNADLVSIAADIVSAYVSNNPVPVAQLPKLIGDIHAALQKIGPSAAEPEVKLEPAVSIRKSVTPDYIICLEDGKKFKSLKRHISTHYKLSPNEYRQKWNLPSDYPMVAPNYAAARSALAKASGLGQQRKVPMPVPVVTEKPKRAARVAKVTTAETTAKPLVRKPRRAPIKA